MELVGDVTPLLMPPPPSPDGWGRAAYDAAMNGAWCWWGWGCE